MITKRDYEAAQRRATDLLKKTSLALTDEELAQIKVADFGLSELDQSGGQILTLVDSEIAVKLIAMFPGQTLPEHRHPPLGDYPGKAETIRCEWGELYLYAEGDPTPNPQGCTSAASPRHVHRLARARSASRRPDHAAAQHLALVPGRAGGCRRLELFLPRHRRAG